MIRDEPYGGLMALHADDVAALPRGRSGALTVDGAKRRGRDPNVDDSQGHSHAAREGERAGTRIQLVDRSPVSARRGRAGSDTECEEHEERGGGERWAFH